MKISLSSSPRTVTTTPELCRRKKQKIVSFRENESEVVGVASTMHPSELTKGERNDLWYTMNDLAKIERMNSKLVIPIVRSSRRIISHARVQELEFLYEQKNQSLRGLESMHGMPLSEVVYTKRGNLLMAVLDAQRLGCQPEEIAIRANEHSELLVQVALKMGEIDHASANI